MTRFIAIVAGAAIVPSALAQATLTVDQSQSSVEVTLSAASLSDSDSSPVMGFFDLELDDYETPGQVKVWDFDLALTEDLNIVLSAGFLGQFTIDLSGLGISFAADGPVGPAEVDANGDFALQDVPANLRGTGVYMGTGLFAAAGSGEFDLVDFSPAATVIAGTISVSNGVVTYTGMLANSVTQDLNGIQVTVEVDGAMVASGDAPACAADLTGEGDVNTNDFFAFLSLYQAQDPRADFAPDGQINTNDFFAFLAAYQAGC